MTAAPRRWAGAALAAAATIVALGASPAAAHGVGGRSDLPLPVWMFAYGAAGALVVSFAALAAFWPKPRLEGGVAGVTIVPAGGRGVATRLSAAGRALGAVLLGVVVGAAAFGPTGSRPNLATVVVYIVFWVGLTFVSALVVDAWRVLNPFPSLAALVGRLRRRPPTAAPPRPYRLGHWPAAGLLFGFVWFELVYPERADPRHLAVAIVVYTAVVLLGAARWGAPWLRQGEAFAAFFGVLAHMAPLHPDGAGRLRLRPPLSGLPSLRALPGTEALVLVALGSTTFDGLSRTQLWLDATAGLGRWPFAAASTLGLLGAVGAVSLAYAGAMRVAARQQHGRQPKSPQQLAAAFVHSLVPIAFAYAVAHYFSFLVLEGQGVVALASDPFGRGWDLFGTAGQAVDFRAVSPVVISWVQVGAIVGGHVAGVVLAHDRALALFPPRDATRSQYPLLAAMVLFTVGGLILLLGT